LAGTAVLSRVSSNCRSNLERSDDNDSMNEAMPSGNYYHGSQPPEVTRKTAARVENAKPMTITGMKETKMARSHDVLRTCIAHPPAGRG
jgi:hypothetical protein